MMIQNAHQACSNQSMKEHHGLLQALPQRIHADSADRHENLLTRNVEAIALLKGLSDALSQLSKDTDGLKGAVTKVDSELEKERAATANRFTISEQARSSVKQVRWFLAHSVVEISLIHPFRVSKLSERRMPPSMSVCFPSLIPTAPPFRSNLRPFWPGWMLS